MKSEYIEYNDLVIDPLDGEIRRVAHVDGESVYMQDGGVMGADEIDQVYTQIEIDNLLSGGYNESPTHVDAYGRGR